MTDRELIRHIERSAGQRAGYKQLVREFGLGGGRERRLLLEHLARLTARGELIKLDRDQWGHARRRPRPATIWWPGGSTCIAMASASFAPPTEQKVAKTNFYSPKRIERRHAGRSGAGGTRSATSRRPTSRAHCTCPDAQKSHCGWHISLCAQRKRSGAKRPSVRRAYDAADSDSLRSGTAFTGISE